METMGAKERIGDEAKEIMGGEGQIMSDLVSHCKDFSSYPE